ncbi:hypothetical protein IAQ61_009776 [Plenodomus lingam]|uniref:uncharacterized protein n=1 Tax=Leptosphaeria maculans TaxID=5022 RepID=UPI003328B13C|nr:hypothetical protein IAQ61_009776 [Plenodomus lingam]
MERSKLVHSLPKRETRVSDRRPTIITLLKGSKHVSLNAGIDLAQFITSHEIIVSSYPNNGLDNLRELALNSLNMFHMRPEAAFHDGWMQY